MGFADRDISLAKPDSNSVKFLLLSRVMKSVRSFPIFPGSLFLRSRMDSWRNCGSGVYPWAGSNYILAKGVQSG